MDKYLFALCYILAGTVYMLLAILKWAWEVIHFPILSFLWYQSEVANYSIANGRVDRL